MQTVLSRKSINVVLSNLPHLLSRDSIVYQKSQYLHCDPCKCLALLQNDHANRRPIGCSRSRSAIDPPADHIHMGWASTTNTPKNIHHHNAISSFCTFGGQFVVVLIVCECPIESSKATFGFRSGWHWQIPLRYCLNFHPKQDWRLGGGLAGTSKYR